MTAAKNALGLVAAVLVAAGTAFGFHRMPEAYISLEPTELSGEPMTAITVRMEAEDALVLVADDLGLDADLLSDEAQAILLGRAAAAIKLNAGELEPFGVTLADDKVYLFLIGARDLAIEKAAFLSSAYDRWTNYVEDRRTEEVKTFAFTQGGPHRH